MSSRREPLYNDDCLRLIDEGYTAEELLLERIPQARRRFNHVCKLMRELLDDVHKEFPDAEYYTASGGFNLLIGASHHPETSQKQPELNALSGDGVFVGDGDW